jgi:hypothetical protein
VGPFFSHNHGASLDLGLLDIVLLRNIGSLLAVVHNLLDGGDGFVCEPLVLEDCYLLVLFAQPGHEGDRETY